LKFLDRIYKKAFILLPTWQHQIFKYKIRIIKSKDDITEMFGQNAGVYNPEYPKFCMS